MGKGILGYVSALLAVTWRYFAVLTVHELQSL